MSIDLLLWLYFECRIKCIT